MYESPFEFLYNGRMDEKIEIIKNWLGHGSLNIFGQPFAGKDTQGRFLADLVGGVLLSGGDILRHSDNIDRVQQIMAEGKIIPSDLFEEIVVPFLSKEEFAQKPLVLSEVGRMREEADVIIRATNASGHPQKAVIYLDLPEDAIWQRFEASRLEGDRGQRADDRKEVLQTRLNAYKEKVIPVINFYRENGILIEVDGTLSRDQVSHAIIDSLAQRAQA